MIVKIYVLINIIAYTYLKAIDITNKIENFTSAISK